MCVSVSWCVVVCVCDGCVQQAGCSCSPVHLPAKMPVFKPIHCIVFSAFSCCFSCQNQWQLRHGVLLGNLLAGTQDMRGWLSWPVLSQGLRQFLGPRRDLPKLPIIALLESLTSTCHCHCTDTHAIQSSVCFTVSVVFQHAERRTAFSISKMAVSSYSGLQ